MDTLYFDLRREEERQAGINAAAAALKRGDVIAFPTETVYGLGGLAKDAQAVKRIFAVKGRPLNNPVLVHVSNMDMAKETGHFTPLALELSKLWPAPLSLVVPAAPWVPKEVTAGLSTVGIRMPRHEGALGLIEAAGPIAAPSANLSGRPSPTELGHVKEDLDGKIPVILDGGPCELGLESTVIDATGDVPVILRPGAITCEMVAALVGDCRIAKGVLEQVTADSAMSPGMLHKHYAPRGQAVLVVGEHAAQRGEELLMKALREGKRALMVGPGLTAKDHVIPCDVMGEHGLFYALREADERKAEFIVILGTDTRGENLAYMNRAIRAAGYRVDKE
ncbi:MAG: threonylcarbamoyl-AMP synthase [Clostridiales bacterium]|nr:threonylcarbamoyl-AMP synthase [Clostridiales bacterium]